MSKLFIDEDLDIKDATKTAIDSIINSIKDRGERFVLKYLIRSVEDNIDWKDVNDLLQSKVPTYKLSTKTESLSDSTHEEKDDGKDNLFDYEKMGPSGSLIPSGKKLTLPDKYGKVVSRSEYKEYENDSSDYEKLNGSKGSLSPNSDKEIAPHNSHVQKLSLPTPNLVLGKTGEITSLSNK